MTKIKLSLSRKTVDEKVTDGLAISGKMKVDADSEVSAAGDNLETETNTMETKNTQRQQAKQEAEGKTDALNNQQDTWDTSMNTAATKVQEVYPDDPEKWKDLGFEEAAKPGGPVIEMTQVEDFSITRGDHTGTVDAHWHPVEGAKSYVLYVSSESPDTGNWQRLLPVTKSQATINATAEGFASGDRIWACCQAIGSGEDNVGPKSDPATTIVP